MADRIYERGCTKGLADCNKLKVVWKSDPIPNDPVLYRKALSEDLKKKIREAFYSVKNLPFGEMGTVALAREALGKKDAARESWTRVRDVTAGKPDQAKLAGEASDGLDRLKR